jgi:hypothetical protein
LKVVGGSLFLIIMTRNYANAYYDEYRSTLLKLVAIRSAETGEVQTVPDCFRMFHKERVSNFTMQFFLRKD